MTDKEIIKALECCSNTYLCENCEYYNRYCKGDLNVPLKDALGLIHRQQAEIKEQVKLIDRLQIENDFIKNKALAEGKTTATAIMAEYEQHRMTAEYINKLKAEIERLQADIKKLRDHNSELIKLSFKFRDKAKTVKTEAIKEFIEKFDSAIDEIKFPLSNVVDKTLLIAKQLAHKIAKEMVGEQE